MALVYGLVRAVAVALVKLATWRHRRAKKNLESADKAFKKVESHCKAEEVASGRAADFASQFNLMKQFETREAAHSKWVKAARKLAKRQRAANWLAEFSGKKIPYSFGLIDMALAMKLFEFAYDRNFDFQNVSEILTAWM